MKVRLEDWNTTESFRSVFIPTDIRVSSRGDRFHANAIRLVGWPR